MAQVRPAAVADQFYPAAPATLQAQVGRYLSDARPSPTGRPKALIAPHAGYVYSGPIAGSAYASIVPFCDEIDRVVLLGPAHRVYLRGLAAPVADAFETPLGRVPIDRAAITALLDLPQVGISSEAHALEHSLEVQLPFLQTVLETFTLVPLLVGDATGEEVAEVLDRVWGGRETLIVVSSDLSHYYDDETAHRLDARTSRAIEAMQPEAIESEGACGQRPIQGLLLAARARQLLVDTVDLRTSGDTHGPRDQVVGYGAYVLS